MNAEYNKRILCLIVMIAYIAYHHDIYSSDDEVIPLLENYRMHGDHLSNKGRMFLNEAQKIADNLIALSSQINDTHVPAEQFINILVKPALTYQDDIITKIRSAYLALGEIQAIQGPLEEMRKRYEEEKNSIQMRLITDSTNQLLLQSKQDIENNITSINETINYINCSKSNIENIIDRTTIIAQESVPQIIKVINNAKERMIIFINQTGIKADEKKLRTDALQIIEYLIEIEKNIARLLQDGALINEISDTTDMTKNIVENIFPLTKQNLEKKEGDAQQLIQQTKALISQMPPIESNEQNRTATPIVPCTPTPLQENRPGEETTTPTLLRSGGPTQRTAPLPPMGPPGKAHESINKANSKMQAAVRRLDAIKGYFKDITTDEKIAIKNKTQDILKEYPEITHFVNRIKQIKREPGIQIDEAKIAPFNTFISLTDKLTAKIKAL